MTQTKQVIKETLREFVEEQSINSLIEKLKNELDFHKNFLLTHLQLKENFVTKLVYIEKYQKNLVEGLYSKNSTILESYSHNFTKRIISESVYNFENEINKFNNFILSATLYESKLITEEGWWDDVVQGTQSLGKDIYNAGASAVKNAGNAVYNAGQTVVKGATNLYQAAKNALTNALNHIKKYGIENIMEGLRSALMSGIGTAVQIALSFTGVGAIANEVAWGIMTLYDAYQYFTNSKSGSLSNLIIDLISLLTAGSLGKVLGKFVGGTGTKISTVLKNFTNGGLGKFIKPVLGKIQGGTSTLTKYLGEAATFMKDKMGITWVANLINSVKSFFKQMSDELGEFIGGKVVSKQVGKSLVRKGVQLGTKFDVKVLSNLATKSEKELAKMIGKPISRYIINKAKEFVETVLIDKPTNYVLAELDKKYGTEVGDLYALSSQVVGGVGQVRGSTKKN